ncbi:MAG TPA: hypothetical protein VFM98_17865 [Ramlibacter sp.]|uniref:hypothetical protein n=1 Tax=Ramlibacter sp. TaxID=1917967 RepID=UPI002D801898|nr:hypothetical protein [Ramlibacter sp.]HET8747472.1 hypothetical protein [Ramlibacter sp.]
MLYNERRERCGWCVVVLGLALLGAASWLMLAEAAPNVPVGARILLHFAGGVTLFSGFGEIMREKGHKHLDRLAVAGHAA